MENLSPAVIQDFKEGDERSFNVIFELFARKVWLFFWQNTHSRETTEELVQDTFLRLWLYRENIDAEQGVKKYLNKIARSVFINWLGQKTRSQLRESEYAKLNDLDKLPGFNRDSITAKIDLKTLLAATQSLLPEKRREVFYLSRVSGLSYDEIASELAIGKETVKDHLRKATRKLTALNKSGDFI